MFDVDLHFRFLRKAAEAFFEFGQASIAATTAWQSHLHAQLASGEMPTSFSPWPAWFGAWRTWQSAMPQIPMQTDMFGPSWWAFMSGPATTTLWQTLPSVAWSSATAWPTAGIPVAWVPWGLYQAPMIAMMVSNGVPYAVAAPTARASTSAMDAAGAAYTQWRLIFGNDEVPIDRERTRARIRSTSRKF